jgi:hypothetical protein
VTCIPIARQRVGKDFPAIQAHVTIEGHPLLDNGPVNTVYSMGSMPRSYKGTEKTRRSSKREGVEKSSREGVEFGRVLETEVQDD